VNENGAHPESGIANEGAGGASTHMLRVFTAVPHVSLSSIVKLIEYVPGVLNVTSRMFDPQLLGLNPGGFCPSCEPPGKTLLAPVGGPQPLGGFIVQNL
jgi:hypothetical protein